MKDLLEGTFYFLIHPNGHNDADAPAKRTLCYFQTRKNKLKRQDILTESDGMVYTAGETTLRNNAHLTFEPVTETELRDMFRKVMVQPGHSDPHAFLMSIARLKGIAEQLPEREARKYFRAMARAEGDVGIESFE